MTQFDESLQKITKGAVIAFIGVSIGMGAAFFSRVLIARIGTEAEYGIFALNYVILNICVIIGSFGLQDGAARNIAFSRGKGDIGRVKELISSTIWTGIIGSVCVSCIIFFTAEIIANEIFDDSTLYYPLRIFALGIPVLVLINVFIAIFRGADNVKPRVYFQEISINLIFLICLGFIMLFKLPFIGVFYSLLASLLITCSGLIIYSSRQNLLPITLIYKMKTLAVNKELLLFSIPLLGVAIMQIILTWTDTLMLGSLKSSVEVGLYNSAYPIAQLILVPMSITLLIYGPVIAGLYARGLNNEIRRNYVIITKWISFITVPASIVLIAFPEPIIEMFFGSNYLFSGTALRILSAGFVITNLLGPNGTTLIAIGRTQFLMWIGFAAAGINIILNFILIPSLEIEGAAIATSTSFVFYCIARHLKIHILLGVNPITKNMIVPVILTSGVLITIFMLINHFLNISPWLIPLILIASYGVLFVIVFISKSIDDDDMILLNTIKEQISTGTAIIKNSKIFVK